MIDERLTPQPTASHQRRRTVPALPLHAIRSIYDSMARCTPAVIAMVVLGTDSQETFSKFLDILINCYF